MLADYNTMFLVEHSPPMRGDKSELVQKIHQGIELKNDTPIRDWLSRHLRDLIQKFKAANHSADLRYYNIIVLTDGIPNPECKDEGDRFDQEDADENRVAFKLIRKRIVEVAKTLDKEYEPGEIGIHFCQIGNDHDALAFLNTSRIDSKADTSLAMMEMFDTIKCRYELDLTEAYYKRLFLGAVDREPDHERTKAHHLPTDGHDDTPGLPYRTQAEQSSDDTIVASSSR